MHEIKNIYDFVEHSITEYESPKGIELEDGWSWWMKGHLRRSFLYLNGQFEEQNENRDLRPNKNIVLPIMNVQYRTEGFDVKDIELYIENPDQYYKSMLVRKYHPWWALNNDIDTFIDQMTVSFCTYGGVLTRKTENAKPEVVQLRTLAFCNQTDILNYPFAIRHSFSPSQLRTENKKWGKEKYGASIDVETLIKLVEKEGEKHIEVFEVHGTLPTEWLGDNEQYDPEKSKDTQQVQIIAFYKKPEGQKQGVCLFRHREPSLPFKFKKRDEVEERAVGRGGVEELFEPQVWTNQNEIWITEMLEGASKTLFASDDPSFKSRNNLSSVKNNEVLKLMDGKQVAQIDTYPRNLALFNDSVARWQQHGQLLGSASDPLLGETPSSGTPFKLFEAQQLESKSMHRYRQGQLATFMDEIYRDWILPHLANEISNEHTFMDELSVDEMQEVVEKVTTKKTNQLKKNLILSGQIVDDSLLEDFKVKIREDLLKQGNKRFFKILKGEMKDANLKVRTNIAGKQKNLALLTDKLVNVMRQYIATPQIRQDPEMAKLLNVILESSGLSPIMFGPAPAVVNTQPSNATQPLQQLSQSQANQQQSQQV